jgi:hypothetical protein
MGSSPTRGATPTPCRLPVRWALAIAAEFAGDDDEAAELLERLTAKLAAPTLALRRLGQLPLPLEVRTYPTVPSLRARRTRRMRPNASPARPRKQGR